MKRMILCLFGIGATLVLLSALVFGGPSSPVPTITASVVDVVDGNTIVVHILAVSDALAVLVGDTVHIRLIGIELTESGKALWEANADMPIARTVYLVVNSMLISMGFAEAVTSSVSTQQAASVATSGVQSEASSSTSAEASAAASTVATSESSVSTAAQSTALTTVLPQTGGCCCCTCDCARPTPGTINLLRLTSCVRHGNYARLEIEAVPGAWY